MKTITSEQARALRTADHVVFRYESGSGSLIQAVKRGPDWRHETTTDVPVDCTTSDHYDGRAPRLCFHMEMNVGVSAAAQTWLRGVRKGSRLALRWVRANQSPVLDEAGLVRDELYLTVQNGMTARTFMVAVQVGLDNSARMTRI